MAGRVTFVGTYAIPEDVFESWTETIKEMTDFVSANSSRLLSYDTYVNDEHTEATTIYVHPDSQSLEEHLDLAATRIGSGVQMVSVVRIDLYGEPSEAVVGRLRAISEASTSFPVGVKRHFYGS